MAHKYRPGLQGDKNILKVNENSNFFNNGVNLQMNSSKCIYTIILKVRKTEIQKGGKTKRTGRNYDGIMHLNV